MPPRDRLGDRDLTAKVPADTVWSAFIFGFLPTLPENVRQLHSSLAGGNAVQSGMDGVMLPAPPNAPCDP
jgi:hypothetical protein